MKIQVRYCGRIMVLALDNEKATLGHLKDALYQLCRVPVSRQSILFQKHKPITDDNAILSQQGISDGCTAMLIGAAEVSSAERQHSHPSTKEDHHHKDEDDAPSLENLFAIQQEAAEGYYSCSYSFGYVSQESYICRTCADNRDATPSHVICGGCAMVCHKDHDVEFWGRRLHTRCDCCTSVFTNSKHRCKFIVKEVDATAVVPHPKKLPKNVENLYPEDASRWCACKQKTEDEDLNMATTNTTTQQTPRTKTVGASSSGGMSSGGSKSKRGARVASASPTAEEKEAEDEDGGGCGTSCLLCNQCFWRSHLRKLHVDHLSVVPCYGDVVAGDVVTYRCRTCQYLCCWPCRLRCHRDHDVAERPIVCSTSDQTEAAVQPGSPTEIKANGDEEDCELIEGTFSCGCCMNNNTAPNTSSTGCSIQETTVHSNIDPLPISNVLSRCIVENDDFMYFVCGTCMQQHESWLLAPATLASSVGNTALTSSRTLNTCWHGQKPTVIGRNKVKQLICCEAMEASSSLYYPYHGMLIPKTFFTEYLCNCELCTPMFEELVPGCYERETETCPPLLTSTQQQCSHCEELVGEVGFVCTTCVMKQSYVEEPTYYLCESCHDQYRKTIPPFHPVEHEFMQDTFENLWKMFGASLVQFTDPATQQWMVAHWGDSKELMFDILRDVFAARRVEPGSPNRKDSVKRSREHQRDGSTKGEEDDGEPEPPSTRRRMEE